jgi:NAD(P)-dependent dehydrogenase (short-subunit alcohol dehydrogenase family)
MEIKGHNGIFVGGASGMALATAEKFRAGGGNVAILDLPTSEGAAVAERLGGTYHECNVMDYDGAGKAIADAVSALGSVHFCVNTAGGGLAKRTLAKEGPHPLEDFQRVIDLNLIASFNVSRLVSEHMSKNEPNEEGERGCIINTASIAAFEGQIGQVAYSAAKAGIVGMTFVMARDLGSLGIRANCIAPSLFDTGLTSAIPDEFALQLTKDAAFPKRMGKPIHFAIQAISMYENAMMNGGTVRVDAGQRFAPK